MGVVVWGIPVFEFLPSGVKRQSRNAVVIADCVCRNPKSLMQVERCSSSGCSSWQSNSAWLTALMARLMGKCFSPVFPLFCCLYQRTPWQKCYSWPKIQQAIWRYLHLPFMAGMGSWDCHAELNVFRIELRVYLNWGTHYSLLSQLAPPSQLVLPSCSIFGLIYILSRLCYSNDIVAFALHFDCNSFRSY